ncbi:MSCRAMM family protein [Geoalkalibacter sp.]|uniref:MSCRAMM family protein n=1 Tax=Geoalkalibacter sp. TaxID=3041440 RepID=UPI00272E4738|nr:hypothetical protein [Geoalkalibacter sp.]
MKPSSVLQTLLVVLALLLVGACAPATRPTDTRHVTQYRVQDGKTGITGQVLFKESGMPLRDAYVNVYPDTLSNLLGPSQFISSPTDAEGRYLITDVPPGTYYVVARKRISGQPTGPLSPGDYFSEHQRISTEVVAGKLAVVDLPVVPIKAPMFFKRSVGEQRTDTGIRGVLTDENGKPVPGSFAIAYVNDDIKRAPDFASTLTDQEGRFVLYLPKGGTYYLAARIHAWDMPRPGEPYGLYGNGEPKPLEVAEGQFIEGLRLVMRPFEGEYKPGKSRRPY